MDIKEAWRYSNLKENDRKARKFNDNYEDFEEKLIEVLQAQIKENRYEVHKNYPVIRDILASMAEYQQNTVVPNELNQILIDSKIATIESYEKLPVWITYAQYEDLIRKNSLSEEPHFESLHIYLQNLCGRIFHFKDIPALADIVFIDPNWLHQTIYKVLSQEVLDNQGEFTLEDADAVIDGNILDATTFMEAMMAFDLVFEIPQQSPRRFIAPQYLPNDCPLSGGTFETLIENYGLNLTLEFPYYLPSSLISRIISQKGNLIKDRKQLLWRNGLFYIENSVSIFIFCQPTERKIEIYLGKNTSIKQKEMILREFMQLLENRFSDDIEEVLISLPNETGKAKWKDLYHAKKEKKSSVINYGSRSMSYNLDSRKYDFLFEQFENKPVNIFVCYAHDDFEEMVKFVEPLKREMFSFATQHQIKINPFTDQQLTPGMRWDDILKAKIKENDILICLLSPSFFTSGYIQQNECGQVMREIASGERDSLITPIYLKSCYVSESNPIANLQFFKPLSTNFVKENITNFSFNNLLGQSDDRLIDNYVLKFVESIKSNILEIWEKK